MRAPFDQDGLEIETATRGGRRLRLTYAPFDHVNETASVVIVGLTPGARQAADSLLALRAALLAGVGREPALALAKSHASFSGPMRANMVRMLDAIGLAAWLGIGSTGALWGESNHLVHFTSAVRYPVAVDGANWSGKPDMLRNDVLRRWFEQYAVAEFGRLRSAIIVPLGPAVTRAMRHLASQGVLDRSRILDGLPHPSGANAERVACFLGTKPAKLASAKTDADALVASRMALSRQISSINRPLLT